MTKEPNSIPIERATVSMPTVVAICSVVVVGCCAWMTASYRNDQLMRATIAMGRAFEQFAEDLKERNTGKIDVPRIHIDLPDHQGSK